MIKISKRQKEIIEIVKSHQPITSERIADNLNVTRAALRPDLSILTMIGVLDAKPKVGYVFITDTPKSSLGKNVQEIKVREVMSKPVIVDEGTKVYDAIIQLFLNDSGTLFVHNNGYLVGAASRKDFLKIAIGGTDTHQVPVGIIMTRMPNIVIVKPEDDAYFAAQKIIEHEIDCLPVVEAVVKDNRELYRIVGKISKTNITKLFVKLTQ